MRYIMEESRNLKVQFIGHGIWDMAPVPMLHLHAVLCPSFIPHPVLYNNICEGSFHDMKIRS